MALLQGTKALEVWCRKVTEGYANVNVVNMTTSWRSGLGFCAIIHKFRPELIAFDTLDPDDAFGNNELAFTTAEQHLGIPALLDPQDMVECELLDRLSILTYLSQFYQTFHGATGPCKETTPTKLRYISSSNCSSGSSTPSRSSAGRLALPGRRNEPCRVCNKPVFILERLNVTGKLLHRTCFKCARCKNQLSIASYYETEEGAYCCEMCPDEEVVQTEVAEANKKVVEDHMDSDEDSLPESMQATTNTTNNNENNASNNNATEVTTTTAVDKENNITELKAAEWNDEVKESENLKSEDVEAATAVTASEAEDVSKDAKQPSADDATENNDKELDNGVGDGEVESKSKDEESGQAAEVNVVDTEKDATSINSETKVNIEHEEQPNETKTVSSKEDNPDQADAKDATMPLPECDQFQEKSDEAVVQEQEDVNDKAVDEVNDEVTHGDDNQKEATQDAQADHDHDEAVAPLEHETSAAEDGEESATNMHSTMISDEPGEKEQEDKSADTNISEAAAASALEESYPDDLNPFGDEDDGGEKKQDVPVEEDKSKNISTNPFGSDFEDSDGDDSNAAVRKKSAHGTPLDGPPKPPRTSLNPFGSDFEDDDENLSIQSGSPNTAVKRPHRKKKRHAPPPPTNKSPMPSPIPRPAPRTSIAAARAAPPPRPPPPNVSQLPKERKEADNINRRSQILEQQSEIEVESNQQQQQPPSIVLTPMSPDKAQLEGKWKKKKGPAPPRPIPPKRQVKKLPRKAVNTELHDIEVKQQELERQGVELEKSIREVCAKSDAERTEAGLDNNDRDSLGPEAEDLIMQLFELVNEKNDLFRRQTELMYMKREHRLEEEHADIEHQIRVLMAKPDAMRTDEDKIKEDKLIERLMVIVGSRNEIVDCLEMDRLRELEEDESIEIHLGEYAAIKPPDDEDASKKKKKKAKKEKKKKKLSKSYDADKDIDTSEFPSGGPSLSNSPRPSPKKSPLAADKDKAKKLKKKILASIKPMTLKKSDKEKE